MSSRTRSTALTRREVQVALLVAEGLTNRQIAGRLVVSERTAEHHVEQIRNKLGFSSRTQIAAWAVAQDLRTAAPPPARRPPEPAPPPPPEATDRFTGSDRTTTSVPRSAERAQLGLIPTARTSLLGRQQDLDQLTSDLARHRLLTLVGPGGVGKTRLAGEAGSRVAQEYRDGVWLVDLTVVPAGAEIQNAVVASLGVGAAVDGHQVELANWLARRQLLLILDNCEHVIESTVRLATDLLSRCAEVKILATSRERLAIDEERVLRVGPLAVPDTGAIESVLASPATQLFVERADAAGLQLLTDAELQAVGRVVRVLDGLPLAIELASARAVTLGALALEGLLGTREQVLRSRRRAGRHAGITELIDWSYDLLSPEEQAVFRRLAVFAGPTTFVAADAVVNPNAKGDGSVVSTIADLIDRSLVVPPKAGGERWSMLQTIRSYALNRLVETGEEARFREAHAAWALDLARAAHEGLGGPDYVAALDRLEAERPNLLAALDHLVSRRDQRAVALAVDIADMWWERGPLMEGRDALAAVLPIAADDATAVRALAAAGKLEYGVGEYTDARGMAERSLALAQRLGRDETALVAMHTLANISDLSGDRATSIAINARIVDVATAAGDEINAAIALSNLTAAHAQARRFATARECSERALALARKSGAPHVNAMAGTWSGVLACEERRYGEALLILTQSVDLSRRGLPFRMATTLHHRGRCLTVLGRFAEADADLRESAALSRDRGDDHLVILALWALADLERRRGNLAAALTYASDGLRTERELDDLGDASLLIDVVARVLLRGGDVESGALLLGASVAMDERDGFSLESWDRDGLDEIIEQVHANPAAAELFRRGGDLTAAEAISLALEAAYGDGQPAAQGNAGDS